VYNLNTIAAVFSSQSGAPFVASWLIAAV